MNLTEAELAERFYGAATPSPAPAAPVDIDPTDAVAAKLYTHQTSNPRAAAPAQEAGAAPIIAADAVAADAPKSEQAEPQAAEHGFAPTAEDGRAYDGETLAAYAGVVREAGIDHNVAQQVWTKMAGALAARQEAAVVQQAEQWAEAARSDPEIAGSDGSELQSNLQLAKGLLRRHGSPELRQLLHDSGLSNHPELIRLLVRAARDGRGW